MKKKHGVFFGFAVLMIAAICTLASCDWGGGDDGGGSLPNVEVAVTGLTNVPDTAYVNAETDLCSVTVSPANADRKAIVWSVKTPGNTGVTGVEDNRFTPTSQGTLVLTATVAGGKADGTDFTSDQTITVKSDDRKNLSGTVTITTNASKGMMLGGVNPAGSLTNATGIPVYHWQRSATNTDASSDWVDIKGAYGLTYTLGNDDVNKYIRLKVSYSGAKGSVASNVAGPVQATLPAVWKPEPSINVSDATAWGNLLTTIAEGNLISLDLSDCTMTGTEFDPGTNNTGESKILSLTLPDAAKSIKAGITVDWTTTPTFKNFTALTSVSGANITEIGDYAFRNCAALVTANFPKVETIGDYAFYSAALTEADFPKAKTIGDDAFESCAALTEVNLPAAETIGEWAFYGCAALTKASLPAATNLDQFAFEYCTALAEVNLPVAETIGLWAFAYDAALTTASFPKAKSIGVNAFANTALTSVSLPATLTSIGDAAFVGCANLAAITVDPGNNNYKAQNGMLLNHDGDTLVAYPSAKGGVTLDAAITTIGLYAFSENATLTAVNAPAAETIGSNAFYSNTALTTVNLPKAETIGSAAFDGCTALVSVSAPAAETIGAYAFEKCAALAEVSLPKAKTIGTLAFAYNPALKTVNLPKAETIGRSVFYDCTGLASVNLPAATYIRAYAFQNTGGTALTVTLGNTVPTLEYRIFGPTSDAKTVTVKVPANAEGYVPQNGSLPVTYPANGNDTTVCWGNGFRGGGWTDAGAFPATNGGATHINSDITLIIESIQEGHH